MTPLAVTVDALQLGVPRPAVLATGQEKLFQVTVGQGETLQVSVAGKDGSAHELYIRRGAAPTGAARMPTVRRMTAMYSGMVSPG